MSNVTLNMLVSLTRWVSFCLICYLMYFSQFSAFSGFGALLSALLVTVECTPIVTCKAFIALNNRNSPVFVKNNPLKTQKTQHATVV